MTAASRITFVLLWFASPVLVGVLASAQTRPQTGPIIPGPIISGSDIGFRPEGWRGRARTGTWLVRVNGEWVEAVDSVKTLPATH
jgi:hypothetical protein